MAEYLDSEQEQLEALKRWWKENGTTAIVGLVVGLGGVFGWTWWQDYSRGQDEAASMLYQAQADAATAARYDAAQKAGDALLSEYPSSGYAGLSALVAAKASVDQGKFEDAQRQLRWLLENDVRKELKLTARLRLAQLMLQDGNHDGAHAILAVDELGPYQATFDELRGDVYVAESKSDDARQAYEQALGRLDDPSVERRRVQMKLDDLGHVSIPTS